MITFKAKNSRIYKELETDKSKELFDSVPKKFISNIDSLYFSVSLVREFTERGETPIYDEMVKYMQVEKEKAAKQFEPIKPFENTIFDDLSLLYIMHGFGFERYTFDFHKPDKYSFFVMGYQMEGNLNTPQVIVQIKSEALWLYGVDKMAREVHQDLEFFFSCFGIKIKEIKENRIDYAYHTNYIQDPTNYFRTDKLGDIQQSSFERWGQQGSFERGNAEVDYFTLGRRKSNNVFFRIYNKTKEVIEQSYKQFFFDLWFEVGMINKYDLYCYEKAFVEPSNYKYKYLQIARLQFYLEYGNDVKIHQRIEKLIDPTNKRMDHDAIFKLAEELTPPITIVLNVEFETKRKFYRTFDKASNLLKVTSKNVPPAMQELYKKLDNLQLFHNYLTCKTTDLTGTIRFLSTSKKFRDEKKKDIPTSDFWIRLQRTNLNRKINLEKIQLVRAYTEELNADLIKRRVANGISVLALYNHLEDVSDGTFIEQVEMMQKIKEMPFEQDVVDFMSMLNENDIEKSIAYKIKKAPEMSSKVTSGKRLAVNRELRLIDKQTGAINDTGK